VAVRADRLMCVPDWRRVPKPLRDAIWEHYRHGQTALTCTPEYREALRAVMTWARERQAEADAKAARAAELAALQEPLW
jgi:hypothetical protein